MKDLDELKRLLKLYRHSDDALDLAALKIIAVKALPELIAEIERLRECADIRTDAIIAAGAEIERVTKLAAHFEERSNEKFWRAAEQAQRIERLEAALRYYSEICDCPSKGRIEPHDEACHLQRARAALEPEK
jgi:hypothetical protein